MIAIGSKLRHSTGVYTVEWIAGEYCGLFCDGAFSWTGKLSELESVGFELIED